VAIYSRLRLQEISSTKKENPTTDNIAIQEKQLGGNWGSRWEHLLFKAWLFSLTGNDWKRGFLKKVASAN